MSDVIERIAFQLYLFDGGDPVPDESARKTEEIYRRRATDILAIVRDHDAKEA